MRMEKEDMDVLIDFYNKHNASKSSIENLNPLPKIFESDFYKEVTRQFSLEDKSNNNIYESVRFGKKGVSFFSLKNNEFINNGYMNSISTYNYVDFILFKTNNSPTITNIDEEVSGIERVLCKKSTNDLIIGKVSRNIDFVNISLLNNELNNPIIKYDSNQMVYIDINY